LSKTKYYIALTLFRRVIIVDDSRSTLPFEKLYKLGRFKVEEGVLRKGDVNNTYSSLQAILRG